MSKLQENFSDRILVVDDEEFCLTGIKVILKCIGIDVAKRVDTAMSGVDALEIVKSAQVLDVRHTLIITDIQMPMMDGIQFTRGAREYYQKSLCLHIDD